MTAVAAQATPALICPLLDEEAFRSYHDRAKLLNGSPSGALGIAPPGSRWARPDWNLPTGLASFAQHLGPSLERPDPHHWVARHTLSPYFQQAMRPASQRALVDRLLVPQDGPRRPLLPIALGEWFAQSAVACPACDDETLTQHGFSIVRRASLLPFATRCIVHDEPLSAFPNWTPLGRGRNLVIPRRAHRTEEGIRFTVESAALLTASSHCEAEGALLGQLGALLQTRGFTARGGNVRRAALAEALVRHAKGRYEHAELDQLLASHERVKRLLQPLAAARGVVHPAVGIALRRALEDLPEVEQLALSPVLTEATHQKLASALHQASSATAAAKLAGVSVNTAVKHAHSLGKSVSSRPKKLKGPLLQQLNSLLAEGRSVAEVARVCALSPVTVYRRLNADAALNAVAAAEKEARESAELTSRKHRWEMLIEAHPTDSVSKLRAHAPADYSYLYRNARDWLQTIAARVSGAAARSLVNSSSMPPAVLRARNRAPDGADFALAQRIRGAADADKLKLPKRNTVTSLLNQAGRRQANQQALPSSAAVLRQRVECQEEFVRRRLEAAALRLLAGGQELVPWRIVREARLRPNLVEALGVDILTFADQASEKTLKAL